VRTKKIYITQGAGATAGGYEMHYLKPKPDRRQCYYGGDYLEWDPDGDSSVMICDKYLKKLIGFLPEPGEMVTVQVSLEVVKRKVHKL
jgi:hypothetical protein